MRPMGREMTVILAATALVVVICFAVIVSPIVGFAGTAAAALFTG